jgi:hypothetical protein
MRIFSIMALVALAACNGGDCDNTECANGGNTTCANCDTDTGTEPAAMGSFTAPKIALPGTLEDCISNLNEVISVPSGETKTGILVGEYDLTFGSLNLATEYSDWLGVHVSSDGSQWVAPSDVASIVKDATLAPEPPVASRYIGGETWTCSEAGSTDEDDAETGIVAYHDTASGLTITLPKLGTEALQGLTFGTPTEDCDTVVGEFISQTQAVRDAWCHYDDLGDVEQHTQCWKGEFAVRPTIW